MSRTVKIVECSRDPAIIDEQIRNILANDGYKLINYNDEMVWKMGTGLMTAMHYIKFEFSDNVLCISGWVHIILNLSLVIMYYVFLAGFRVELVV